MHCEQEVKSTENNLYVKCGCPPRRNTGLDWGAGEGGRCRAFITDNFKSARHKKELKVARCRWEIILPNGNYSHSSDMGDNRGLINSFIHFFFRQNVVRQKKSEMIYEFINL